MTPAELLFIAFVSLLLLRRKRTPSDEELHEMKRQGWAQHWQQNNPQ